MALAAARAAISSVPNVDRTAFMLCDIQERFRSLIYRMPTVIATGRTMIKTAQVLGAPLIVTQQYPKAFKTIVPELNELLQKDGAPKFPTFDKLKFSMITPEVSEYIKTECPEFETAVLFGIETHVCVQQTCMELLHARKRVYIVVDGVSSQRPGDRTVALLHMSSAGAHVTTTESLLYTLIGGADHPKFKDVSKILVDHNKLAKDVPSLDHLH